LDDEAEKGLILVFLLLVPTSHSNAQNLTVARVVVDGDTIDLSDGTRVRLIGIDTPDKWQSEKLEEMLDVLAILLA